MTNYKYDERTETKLIALGRKKRYLQGGVNPVIQRASSLVFDTLEAKKFASDNRANGELFYGRRGTLTHFSFQDSMAELEGGAGCALYPCGAAAVTNSILAFVASGDHILMTAGAYEPTQDFCNKVLSRMSVTTTYYDPMIGAGIVDLIQSNTKVVFLESPSSVTMEVQDVSGMVIAIRNVNPDIIIMIDNTWAAGLLFKPLTHGVDISIQAGTKYIIGHSDAMLGTAVANARSWDILRENSYLMGQMVDADTAYMGNRGLRTLGIRLNQHEFNSIKVATWLQSRPEVARVNHPALPSCKGHEFFKRDFSGSSGLFSFVLKKMLTQRELEIYLENFTYFRMAYSWGGYESLILANQPGEINAIRPAQQIDFTGTIVRIHVGLEHPDDLISDLEAGFDRLTEAHQ
ncbi:cystathionine beta-lyase [Serratia sarumanii]|uniref:cystathionine beta-lyase n=1 Tax=Serratia sarumanii TaxID=3020826 RepID=UPI003F8232A0